MENDKLIYVGPLESQFENLVKSWCGTFSGPAYMNALERLRKAPGVDAIEVIRCKDCVKSESDEHDRSLSRVWCKKTCMYMPETGFCSEGKRRQKHV